MNSQFIYRFAIFLCINLFIVFILNYAVDPLQILRKQTVLKTLFTEEQRLQVPGLINSYSQTAQTALIGSSMTSNFRHAQVENILNEKLIKLSIDGSTPYEQLHVLETILAKNNKRLKHVIWGLDIFSFNTHYGEFSKPIKQYPMYLYGHSFLDKMQYSLSANTLVHSLQTLTATISPISFFRRSSDISQLNIWDRDTGCNNVFEHYDRVLEQTNWITNINSKYNSIELNKYVNRIKKLANQYPAVTFDLFYPPYSIVRYKYLEKTKKLKTTMILRQQFGKGVMAIKNVNLHDISINNEVILDLNYFKDIGHYDHRANNHILQSIKNKKFIKKISELNNNNNKLVKLIYKYDLAEEKKRCSSPSNRTSNSQRK